MIDPELMAKANALFGQKPKEKKPDDLVTCPYTGIVSYRNAIACHCPKCWDNPNHIRKKPSSQ